MKDYREIFNCQHPILAAPMNQVSDFNLARAIRDAGAFPSISIFNYYSSSDFQIELLKADTESFGNDYLLSLSLRELLNPQIVDFIIDYKIKAIEILEKIEDDQVSVLQKSIDHLRTHGTMVFLKVFSLHLRLDVDGLIVKGPEGAGRSKLNMGSLEELFEKLVQRRNNKYPNSLIIPSGGICSAEQVKHYISNGACMVGIGSLFAACKESSVSDETKQKIVDSNSSNLERFSNGQQGLIFSRLERDNSNNTRSLSQGIKSPTTGHIFMGKGIDNITSVLTAKEIVGNLTANL